MLLAAQVRWQRLAGLPTRTAQIAVAFDTDRDRAVAFGGDVGGFYSFIVDTTLEWDGAAWQPLTPATRPPARIRHALVYDQARRRMVLFGGKQSQYFGPGMNDTWEWDGTDWAQRSPAVSPSPRSGHAMVYDERRQRVLLFGGGATGGAVGETWEWDGTTWTQLSPTTSPSPRAGHAMAYDSARGVTVLFGGAGVAGTTDDTWEWDGSDWVALRPATRPPAQSHHRMAYHAARQRMVMFGGIQLPCVDSGWEWDGTDWHPPTIKSPEGRWAFGMVYDPARRRILVTGGHDCGLFGLTVPLGDHWAYESVLPATYRSFGTGCATASGPLTLTPAAGSLPWAGDPLDLTVSAVPSTGALAGILGSSTTAWGPLALPASLAPVGGPLCTLYTGAEAILPLAAAGGLARWSIGIPVSPPLAGQAFYVQALHVGATAVASSDAGHAVVGMR